MSQEQLEFKIGEDEQPATVELTEGENGVEARIADAPEPPIVEKTEDPTPEPVAAQQTTEKELGEYSDNVKKRIDKMTAKLREAQRREQAALEYARSVQTKAAELEHRFQTTDTARLSEARSRAETQVIALKQIIKKAREEGDTDTEFEAHERLTQVLMEQRRILDAEELRQARAPQQTPVQQPVQQPQYQQPQYQQPQYQQPAAPVDPRAEQWAEENEWFGRDIVMTNAVKGVHLQLVTQESFDPQSEEYYQELDRRMRDLFPNKFNVNKATMQSSRADRPVQTVAPASRSSGLNNARRTVKLTPSQVAIAKKLGVPLEEYAKYVKE